MSAFYYPPRAWFVSKSLWPQKQGCRMQTPKADISGSSEKLVSPTARLMRGWFPPTVNPEGIVSSSPGLRGTSYPGKSCKPRLNPNGVVAALDTLGRTFRGGHSSCLDTEPRYACRDCLMASSRRKGRRSLVEKTR